jgi:plasmid stabilization system protein ParE
MLPQEYDLSWNSRIQKDVQKIKTFISAHYSNELAEEIIRGIFTAAQALRQNPERFPRERQLLHRAEMYRYVRHKKYKLLFVVKSQTVHILHIFPERQHPKKIRRIF